MTTNGQEQKTEASDDSNSKSSTDGSDFDLLPLQIDYAWKWFQYHADQRLKAFNFFILFLGALLVAYGTAMKEHDAAVKSDPKTEQRRENTETAANSLTLTLTFKRPEALTSPKSRVTVGKTSSYSYFATWVAACGSMISFAFLCIEIRNAELVECGRSSLNKLEDDLKMKIRKEDKKRTHLFEALRPWNTTIDALSQPMRQNSTKTCSDICESAEESGVSKAGTSEKPAVPLETSQVIQDDSSSSGQSKEPLYDFLRSTFGFFLTHKIWIRLIYTLAFAGFAAAAWWSGHGFNWVVPFPKWLVSF